MNINVATLSGNIGADPEVKESKGVQYRTFSLAVDQAFKTDGEWAYKAQWFRIVAFGKLAARLLKLSKGDFVVVTGSLHQTTYLRKDDSKGHKLEIHAQKIDFPRPKAGAPDGAETGEGPEDEPPYEGPNDEGQDGDVA